MSHTRTALSALALAGAFGAGALASAQSQGTPVRSALAAQTNPVGAKGRTLGLSRVTVPPGAKLALHHHTGTQLAYVDRGALTYTVKTGSVTVRTGAADDHPSTVRRISAGQTGRIETGSGSSSSPR